MVLPRQLTHNRLLDGLLFESNRVNELVLSGDHLVEVFVRVHGV